jgi:ribosome-binding factor A
LLWSIFLVSKSRASRIADRILEELSVILLTETADPRISGISVTGVKVDRELAYADIYVSAVEGSERKEEIIEGLLHAQGFLRSELANRVELRTFPRLRFHWDPTYERADAMDKLIASLHEPKSDEDPSHPNHEPDEV